MCLFVINAWFELFVLCLFACFCLFGPVCLFLFVLSYVLFVCLIYLFVVCF